MATYQAFIDSANNMGIKCAVCGTMHWNVIGGSSCSNCETLRTTGTLEEELELHRAEETIEDCTHTPSQEIHERTTPDDIL